MTNFAKQQLLVIYLSYYTNDSSILFISNSYIMYQIR